MRWSFIQKESPHFKPTKHNSDRAIPRRNKNALKSSSSLYKLDSYLSVASYKVNVFKIRAWKKLSKKSFWGGKRKKKTSWWVTELQSNKLRGSDSGAVTLAECQSPRIRKKGEVTNRGGWYLILKRSVTDLTDNLLLKILHWKRPDTYFA